MKKLFLLLGTISLFFIGNQNIKASVEYGSPQCSAVVQHADGRASQDCSITFKVTEKPLNANKISASFVLQNVTIDESSIKVSQDWYLSSKTDKSYALETTKTSLPVGTYTIATFRIYKIKTAEECFIGMRLDFSKINRSCQIYQNNYYDKDGNITDKLTYQKQCENNACKILSDGTMYDKDGNVTDKLTYQKQCEKNTCTILSDGTIYDKDGNVTDRLTYEKQCQNNICRILSDGTIYGKDGNVTDRLTYDKECGENICKILSDGTMYDKDGNVTDKLTYQKQCEKNICKILEDGTMYDNEGNITDKKTYEKICKNHKCEILEDGTIYGIHGTIIDKLIYQKECQKNICSILEDGTIYGITGNIVTKDIYQKECEVKENTCAIIDGKYYDNNGKEITELEYKLTCQEHKCEVIGDTYFDPNGNKVDKAKYDSLCNTPVENPNTGAALPIATGIIAIMSAVGMIIYAKKTNKMY